LSCFGLRRGVLHHVACWIRPRLQVTFFALLEDYYPGRLAVKDQDKTNRITGVILVSNTAMFLHNWVLHFARIPGI
jgi:hypothetical protein